MMKKKMEKTSGLFRNNFVRYNADSVFEVYNVNNKTNFIIFYFNTIVKDISLSLNSQRQTGEILKSLTIQ